MHPELMKEMHQVWTGKGQLEEVAETVSGTTEGKWMDDTFLQTFRDHNNSSRSEEGMAVLKSRQIELIQTSQKCRS